MRKRRLSTAHVRVGYAGYRVDVCIYTYMYKSPIRTLSTKPLPLGCRRLHACLLMLRRDVFLCVYIYTHVCIHISIYMLNDRSSFVDFCSWEMFGSFLHVPQSASKPQHMDLSRPGRCKFGLGLARGFLCLLRLSLAYSSLRAFRLELSRLDGCKVRVWVWPEGTVS